MPDQYAVIGNPIRQSKSPLIHTQFAKDTEQELTYVALEGPLGGFAAAVDTFRAGGGRGLNVTAPFKLDACAYATVLSPRAQLAGAVNCLKFEGDVVRADNYDGIGLVNDIERNLGCVLAGKRVLLLGAGGAARGALLSLLEAQPATLVIANRTAHTAHALAQPLKSHAQLSSCGLSDLSGERFDVVLNGTSASLFGECPAIPPTVFDAQTIAYEMVYGKGLTPFLRLAQGAGAAKLADGVGMLVQQAVEAFAWWRGVRPSETTARALIAQLTVPLV